MATTMATTSTTIAAAAAVGRRTPAGASPPRSGGDLSPSPPASASASAPPQPVAVVTREGYAATGHGDPKLAPRVLALVEDFTAFLERRVVTKHLELVRRMAADFVCHREATVTEFVYIGACLVTVLPMAHPEAAAPIKNDDDRRPASELLLAEEPVGAQARAFFEYLLTRLTTRNGLQLLRIFDEFCRHEDAMLRAFVDEFQRPMSLLPFARMPCPAELHAPVLPTMPPPRTRKRRERNRPRRQLHEEERNGVDAKKWPLPDATPRAGDEDEDEDMVSRRENDIVEEEDDADDDHEAKEDDDDESELETKPTTTPTHRHRPRGDVDSPSIEPRKRPRLIATPPTPRSQTPSPVATTGHDSELEVDIAMIDDDGGDDDDVDGVVGAGDEDDDELDEPDADTPSGRIIPRSRFTDAASKQVRQEIFDFLVELEAERPWRRAFANLPLPFDEAAEPLLAERLRRFWARHARAVWERNFWAPISDPVQFAVRKCRQRVASQSFCAIMVAAFERLGPRFFYRLEKKHHPGWWYNAPVVDLHVLNLMDGHEKCAEYMTQQRFERFPDCGHKLPLRSVNWQVVRRRMKMRISPALWLTKANFEDFDERMRAYNEKKQRKKKDKRAKKDRLMDEHAHRGRRETM